MGVFIKSLRGEKNISKLKAHIKYIGFRSQEKEVEEKGFFDKDNNFSDYKNFIKRIENHPALRHSMSIKAQKLVFSLRETDYKEYLKSGKDYKDLIRSTLGEYEKKHNVKLDWIASFHNAEDHPHCHIVIKGVSDEKDSEGKFTRIRFTKDDFIEMKNDFNKEFEKEADFSRYEIYDMEKTLKDIGKGFEAVLNEIQKNTDKEINKSEYLKDKEVKKIQQRNREATEERER